MSDSQASKVFMFDNDDPEMQAAFRKARANFRYFWRELAWERRRIVPGLDLACVKAPFSDGASKRSKDAPEVEQMWLSEIDFDGQYIRGVLLNSPNWLKSVKAGDEARFTLEEITDWMYAIGGEVYGAYTVNLMRSRMGRAERNEHDGAWGLDFGDPAHIRVVPEQKKPGGFFQRLFGGGDKGPTEIGEHAASENAAPGLKDQLLRHPEVLDAKDPRGWTYLHQQALAGSVATVKVLLDAGADKDAVTDHGMTALQLAESLGWTKVIALLE